MSPTQQPYFDALEIFKNLASTYTGMKHELVEQGWNEHNAEIVVIVTLQQQPKPSTAG